MRSLSRSPHPLFRVVPGGVERVGEGRLWKRDGVALWLALPCTHIIRSGQLQHAPAVQCGSRGKHKHAYTAQATNRRPPAGLCGSVPTGRGRRCAREGAGQPLGGSQWQTDSPRHLPTSVGGRLRRTGRRGGNPRQQARVGLLHPLLMHLEPEPRDTARIARNDQTATGGRPGSYPTTRR